MKLLCHETNPFKAYSLVAFCAFTRAVCTHHLPKGDPAPVSSHPHPPPPSLLAPTHLFPASVDFPVLGISVDGIMLRVASPAWLALSINVHVFTHVATFRHRFVTFCGQIILCSVDGLRLDSPFTPR